MQMRTGVVAALLLLAFGGVARAQTFTQFETESDERLINLKWGNLSVKPTFAYRQVYDDNVFLSRKEAKGDTISTISPGIEAAWNTAKNEFAVSAGYADDYKEFWHIDRDRVDQFAYLDAKLTLKPWYLRVTHNWSHAFTYIDSQLTPDVPSTSRSLAVSTGVDFEQWGADLEYKRFTLRLRDGTETFEFFDQNVDQGMLRGWKKIGDHVTALVEIQEGQTNFLDPIQDDNDFHQIRLGIVGRLHPRWTVRAFGGYRWVNYHEDSGTNGFDDDFRGVVYSADITWTPPPESDNKVRFLFSRSVRESVLSNFVDTYTYSLSWSHRWAEKLWVTPFGRLDVNDESTRLVPQDQRDLWILGVNATYDLTKWWTLEAGYQYTESRTNDLSGEYVQNKAFVGFIMRF